jgi:hypothetical protein
MTDEEDMGDVVIVLYTQDADSMGWSIRVLFHARYTVKERRWGVLDLVAGTEAGEGQLIDLDQGRRRTQEEVLAENWWLVDWYPSETAARDAIKESQSRVW